MNKQEIEKTINAYCKENGISKKEFSLFPLYIHLNGFSHSIGFIDHKATGEREYNYTSVSFSHYMSESEGKVWGYENEHQKKLATKILSSFPNYCYQNNAKEILF